MSGSSSPRRVAVIDIGKTNAKVALHDLGSGQDVFVRTAPNRIVVGPPYPHFDIEALFRFVIVSLAELAASQPFEAISITTHGASCALIDGEVLVLPILDYEHAGPEALRATYETLRPPFAESASPSMPNGLNLGAQIHWLEETFPSEFGRAHHLLLLPQYWAWRLTGVAASEITSLGCHTDLWNPKNGRFSSLVSRRRWERLFPPIRNASDRLGPLKPEIARAIGLEGQDIPVLCGIHDSNASLLPHLLRREPPFTVLSTGTWIVSFAVGGMEAPIDPAHGLVVNADAFGLTQLCGRFMGGREFDILTGGVRATPSPSEIAGVLERRIMALPSFMPGTGPFPESAGRWTHAPETLSPGQRNAVASFYCAMMAGEVLGLTGARGPTIVEGPFAGNLPFLLALAAATCRPVIRSSGATGTTAGAALLAATDAPRGPPASAPIDDDEQSLALAAYAADWRRLLTE